MPPAPADVTRPRNSILHAAREELTLARQIVVETPSCRAKLSTRLDGATAATTTRQWWWKLLEHALTPKQSDIGPVTRTVGATPLSLLLGRRAAQHTPARPPRSRRLADWPTIGCVEPAPRYAATRRRPSCPGDSTVVAASALPRRRGDHAVKCEAIAGYPALVIGEQGSEALVECDRILNC